MGYNILFIKTAKCATETIRFHLMDYARELGLTTNDGNYSRFFTKNKFNINTNHIWSDEHSLNHFYNSIDKNLPIIKISSVREPLKRLYSHYCYGNSYYNQGMGFNEWYVKVAKGEILDKWYAPQWGDKTNNYMWDYMNIKSIDSIEAQYDLIFIKENFNESLAKLEIVLNYEFKNKNREINKNPKSKEDYQFTEEVKSLFEENNQKDIELYNKCKKIFL